MSNYNSNYEIAQAISERIGVEPIPFDSVYEICLEIYNELGGEPEQFDSVYEILLGILPLVEGGIASKIIDDTVITTNKTWSSNKINTELGAKQGALTAGDNISISGDTISAEGYVFNSTSGSLATIYRQDQEDGGQLVANTASGLGSHAEGYDTKAPGNYGSHAEGRYTEASANGAHAEGQSSQASGKYSHAEGSNTVASGDFGAHAEGCQTKASYTTEGGYNHGVGAHAEGWLTEAKHDGAHAEGVRTLASAQGAHAEGCGHSQFGNVQALATGAHAEGVVTIARNQGEHAEGFRNISHTTGSQTPDNGGNTVHSVGVGTNSISRNAQEIMYNGDMYVFGVGNYDGIHIKNEQGAPAGLQTLQEVIAGKAEVYEVATTAEIQALFSAQ